MSTILQTDSTRPPPPPGSTSSPRGALARGGSFAVEIYLKAGALGGKDVRMPGAADGDYDGVDLRHLPSGKPSHGNNPRLPPNRGKFGRPARSTRFKVIANPLLSLYSLLSLIFTFLVYFRTLKDAPILLVANPRSSR
ncbi:hypothetical protein C8R47DRAFT_1312579 [Mycena vitilis]|nr:hypothetical protein C8R47DRAFT_1312579 [Mycena vitilis]